MVYDITDRKSFENLDVWLKDVKEFAEHNTGIILAGNKVDLADNRAVSTEEGRTFSQKLDKDASFLETSAKNASNVEEAFQSMVEAIFKKKFENQIEAPKGETVTLTVDKKGGKNIGKKGKCNIL
jgi:Ras-related protein Rab-1A